MANDLYNIVLPEKYSYGASFGNRFKTNVIVTNSGKEQRSADWQYSLQDISINYTTKRKEEIEEVENLYLQTKGPLIAFLFNSLKDNEVTLTNCYINEDNLLKGRPKFRLSKQYFFNEDYDKYIKRIFKLQPGTTKIYNNGILQTWDIDEENGTVSLPVLSSKEILSISKATKGIINAIGHGYSIGDRIYLKNILGMIEVNNMVVTVDSVIDADNFRINLNTLSYSTFTYTSLSSFADKYIDGSENITWEGNFYLPVRFKEDINSTTYENFNSFNCSVTLTELRLDEYQEDTLDW